MPCTVTSVVTGLAPGLVRMSRSWRPGPAPPASSHRSEPPAPQGVVTRPRRSLLSTRHSWVPATAGAIDPSPVSRIGPTPDAVAPVVLRTSVTALPGRSSRVSNVVAPEVAMSRPLPRAGTGRSSAGPAEAVKDDVTGTSGMPGMPASSGPGQVCTTRVASEVPTSGACCSPVAATRSTETGRFVATYTRPTPAPATSTTRATPATLIRRAVRRRPAPAPVRRLIVDPPGTRGARRGRRGRPARGRPGPDRCATSGRGRGR